MIRPSETVLVTGARGLAGSAVVEHFENKDFQVVGLTRDTADLSDWDATLTAFRCFKPVHVFHAAATVYGLAGNMANQGKSILDNTRINLNVIEAARQVGVKKITVMGTNAVYPWPPQLPYREETIFDGRPHHGEHAYGNAKRHMLAMLEAYKESYGMDFAYLVSGNLYGPRDKFDPVNGHVLPSLIWKFYEALRTNGEVTIWGDGSATRDFLYSEDLAEIVRLVMDGDTTGPINLGSGASCSIRQIALRLSFISGVPFERVIFDVTKPKGRPDCYADLSKLHALGFKPQFSITEGLRTTWDWYKNSRAG